MSSSSPDQAELRPDGQTEWFTKEVHAHEGQLKAWLRGSFPAVRDVDDVVQESYLKIWKARTLHPIGSSKSYLFTIARNLALNFLRRERGSPLIVGGEEAALRVLDDGPPVADRLCDQEKALLLAQALASLRPTPRAVLFLHKFEGRPQADVARELGLTPKAVECHVAKGLRACAEFLRKRGHEYF